MQSSVARDRQIKTLQGIKEHPMGHLIGAKILSQLTYNDFLNLEYILCPPGAGPFDNIISDIRCGEILNDMERKVDRNILFVRRDFDIKYKKERLSFAGSYSFETRLNLIQETKYFRNRRHSENTQGALRRTHSAKSVFQNV